MIESRQDKMKGKPAMSEANYKVINVYNELRSSGLGVDVTGHV